MGRHGPIFGFNMTWQLTINTFTTIVTFLMVFLIQSSQNRDSQAMQIKLDELIRSDKDAHNTLLDLEELTEAELIKIKSVMNTWQKTRGAALRRGRAIRESRRCEARRKPSMFVRYHGLHGTGKAQQNFLHLIV